MFWRLSKASREVSDEVFIKSTLRRTIRDRSNYKFLNATKNRFRVALSGHMVFEDSIKLTEPE